jgi:hypothetical protein
MVWYVLPRNVCRRRHWRVLPNDMLHKSKWVACVWRYKRFVLP